jgi:hypothetical protein
MRAAVMPLAAQRAAAPLLPPPPASLLRRATRPARGRAAAALRVHAAHRQGPLFSRPPPLAHTRDAAAVLGLSPGATPAAAVAALQLLTLIYHPNNNGAPNVRAASPSRLHF